MYLNKELSKSKKNIFLIGEQPLLDIDDKIKSYAKRNKMKLSKNYQDWPERSLSWKNNKISKTIQIYLEKENSNKFLIWGCAYKDKLSSRYWWKKEPITFEAPLDWKQIESLFNLLKKTLDNIEESQLKLER